MKSIHYSFTATVWLYPEMAGWHFVSVPEEISQDIKLNNVGKQRGRGSVPITAKIGKTSWKTSIFPDKETGGYLLPIKVEVRKKESIQAEDRVELLLEVNI